MIVKMRGIIFVIVSLFSFEDIHPSTIVPSVISDKSSQWFLPLFAVEPPSYLNIWAVFIDNNVLANAIASKYGFINKGKVSVVSVTLCCYTSCV